MKIEHIRHHTGISPDEIVKITYVPSNSSHRNNEGVLLLRRQKLHDGTALETVIATHHSHASRDVRGEKRNVQAAYCRLTGMKNSEMRKLSEEYAANEKIQERKDRIKMLLGMAADYGINISIEE